MVACPSSCNSTRSRLLPCSPLASQMQCVLGSVTARVLLPVRSMSTGSSWSVYSTRQNIPFIINRAILKLRRHVRHELGEVRLDLLPQLRVGIAVDGTDSGHGAHQMLPSVLVHIRLVHGRVAFRVVLPSFQILPVRPTVLAFLKVLYFSKVQFVKENLPNADKDSPQNPMDTDQNVFWCRSVQAPRSVIQLHNKSEYLFL